MALKGGQIEPFKGSRNTEYFVNPLDPQAQAYQRALIEEVAAKYSIDGIILDWLRFDDYPMDLSPTTRERFQQQTGVDPVTIDFSRPSQARERWNAFRTDGIGAYVNDVRRSLRPEVMLGVFILPPDFVEVGQDSAKFNDKSQVLAPMCYSRDWGFPLNWIWNRCLASTVNKAGDATVLPTLDSGLHDNEYRQIMRRIRRDFPNIRAIAWFHHGKWNDDLMRHLSKVSSW
jgi:hypothetical protein